MPILRAICINEFNEHSEQSRAFRLFSNRDRDQTPTLRLLERFETASDSVCTMADGTHDAIDPQLTPDEANRIIHSHRKVRYGTACWPCRQRKVKCDNKHPCENCVKRDHAGLCSYNPKQNAVKATTGSVAGIKRPRSPGSEGSSRKEEDRWPRTNDEDGTNESRYLGQNSIAAFLSEETRAGQPEGDGEQDVIRKDIMPILGLQISTAPYPFMSKEHMDKIRLDIAAALPSDRDVLKTFQIYKQIVQPFWGLLIDVEDFESKLCIYLEDRGVSSKQPTSGGKGVSSAWLGMLFAVLAVASNYTELSYHKRVAASQAFGFVLANDMKAEASWALIGLTCRLAQALGLHRGPSETARITQPTANDLPRRKLWWTIVWQDSLLSLSFDRSPIATMTRCELPLGPSAMTDGWSYTEAMYRLCQKILEGVNNDSSAPPNFDQIIKHSLEVENIRQQVQPRLRQKDACREVQDWLQYYAIRLHTSFVVSVLCRPALRRGDSIGIDAAQKSLLAEKCKQNLAETVRMYLKMHSLSVIPTRSWAFTYHGLSSAVLLGILGETKTDPEVRQLQGDLISALSTTAARDQTSAHLPQSEKDIELSGPLSRALTALKNIYDHGWVVEGKPGNGLETQPFPTQDQTQFEQQHNAAIAMASMQNGLLPPLDYSQQMMAQPQPLGMASPQLIDQTLNMSPMDLFDSIFWDPYPYGGMDQIGFDYSQPMYPQQF
ncbi:hypothetical protein G7Y89_g2291 [Cudoniella acicularis]|uniref:Zn(2)-C6 fungal-type domain-containing protein n=1 Tax=Cudoniella acicularis TaxID=354080 RepID=A0A8H4RWK4_9HELO|nr:hypothetical protein G7Y89_g2291 [Cudoniella acicularis]